MNTDGRDDVIITTQYVARLVVLVVINRIGLPGQFTLTKNVMFENMNVSPSITVMS